MDKFGAVLVILGGAWLGYLVFTGKVQAVYAAATGNPASNSNTAASTSNTFNPATYGSAIVNDLLGKAVSNQFGTANNQATSATGNNMVGVGGG